jgi:hypothetical protein
MATFASDFDKYSVPMPTYSTPAPTVPSSPGAQATALSGRSAQMQAEAPETFRAPRADEFSSPSYYAAAKTKYDTLGNWYTPENTSQMPINATSAGLQSIQSQLQQNSGLSSSIDPNLTQDAFAGNLAMALRNSQNQQPQYGMVTPTPTGPAAPTMGGQSDALSRYLAQSSQTVANYTPTAVQGVYGGKDNGYTLTRSGLSEPDSRQFTNQGDYQQALNAYAKMQQTEELTALQSDSQRYVNSQNAYQKMIDEMARRTSAIEGEQKELGRKAAIARNDLANRLAARGISENTDSSAQQQFAELDRLNAEAQNAVRQAAALDSKEFQSAEEAKMSAALKARVAEIQAEQEKIAAVKQNADKNAQDLLNLEAKEKDYYSKIDEREGNLAVKQQLAALKEMLTPAQIANLEAGTDYKGAQTDYLSGAKTDLTNSQIAKTDAQTNRITTLLPAELAKMNAMTAKLRIVKSGGGKGGGGAATLTPAELEAVYRLNGGKAPTSEKTMAQLVNQVRTVSGDVDNLVEVQNQAAATRAAVVKEATNAVSGGGNELYDLFGAK